MIYMLQQSDFKSKYFEDDNNKTFEFLVHVDDIFVVFTGNAFRWIIGIPIGTNVPLV